MEEISTSELFQIQKSIVERLRNEEPLLKKIAESQGSLVEKWQQFVAMILPIQLEVIEEAGFEGNQEGLSYFNELWMEAAAEEKELEDLNKEKWVFLFEKAFGLEEVKEISLTRARSLVKEITKEMLDEDFLELIEKEMSLLSHEAPMIQKRMTLLNLILPLHLRVMEEQGFKGDEGYVQAQRALTDYYSDPEIRASSTRAQLTVFRKAKLL